MPSALTFKSKCIRMNLILCGLQKCGKSTVGKGLAQSIHFNFIDTDHLIEQAYYQKTNHALTCRQIYHQEGETFFRLMEKDQIKKLHLLKNSVIALGGGSLMDESNRLELKKVGTLIYLKTSAHIIWERISQTPLPSYLQTENPKVTFNTLVKKRIPFYESSADIIIDTDHLTEKDVEEKIKAQVATWV